MRKNRSSARAVSAALVVAIVAGSAACTNGGGDISSPADVRSAYVLLGPDGEAIARAITVASTCPAISLDGATPVQMSLRAGAAVIPERPTAYSAEWVAPTSFPVTTCDLRIPGGTASARLGSQPLPLPRRQVQRILVIGDTGCRMKVTAHKTEEQACDDPARWPFKAIADLAASMAPDVVVHVGDFHYRETPCPAGSICGDVATWGFGWASWDPDFFTPAASLLAAAPWIVLRGDHETCDRGGQGWWRFLDPRPLAPRRNCNLEADDPYGNYSDPYVVPLADDLVAVVLDTGVVGETYDPESAEVQTYTEQAQMGFALAAPWQHSLLLKHQPILAYQSGGSMTAAPGNVELQGVLQRIYGDTLVPGAVDAVLSGHAHEMQMMSYTTGQPPEFAFGNGGTSLVGPFSDFPNPPFTDLPTPYANGTLDRHIQYSEWGFMVMERTVTGWTATAYDQQGNVITRCDVDSRVLNCMK